MAYNFFISNIQYTNTNIEMNDDNKIYFKKK